VNVRRRAVFAAVAAVLLLGAAGVLWFRVFHEPERTLEPAWDAVVVTIAGGGVPASPPQTPYAIRFADPFGIASSADGTIYVADGVGAHRIYRITPGGVATVLAGSEEGFADGPGTAARFDTPSGLAVDAAGTLYVGYG